jgi:hypothetical protein
LIWCWDRYWEQSITELKKDHPTKIIIASIMSAFIEEDWKVIDPQYLLMISRTTTRAASGWAAFFFP